ncbi:unnamed protein product [Caenorhabditis sp. 36 PRJEB53466]|nr:unnamed protein product [Caenorhabditis sp. 36 PRJEB53466]
MTFTSGKMVKSPASSPDRKKSKLDVYPMEVRDPKEREINPTLLLNFTTALSGFEIPTEEQLVTVKRDEFRHHPNEDVEQYFRASTQWGVPAIAWSIVRPAFLWKLEFCITEFMVVEKRKKEELTGPQEKPDPEKQPDTPVKEKLSIMGHKVNLIKTTPVVFNTEEAIEFVLSKAKTFDGFPFTWQRLCELLIDPMRHYNSIDKFLRAIDKVINVVTTINENGSRQFGEWEVPSSTPHHLESVFFGAVDEVEAMEMEEKQKNESSSNEEPLDMSQKTSMPAPRVSNSSPVPPSFAPPTAPVPTVAQPEENEEEMPEAPVGEEDEKENNSSLE